MANRLKIKPPTLYLWMTDKETGAVLAASADEVLAILNDKGVWPADDTTELLARTAKDGWLQVFDDENSLCRRRGITPS